MKIGHCCSLCDNKCNDIFIEQRKWSIYDVYKSVCIAVYAHEWLWQRAFLSLNFFKCFIYIVSITALGFRLNKSLLLLEIDGTIIMFQHSLYYRLYGATCSL